MCDMRHRRVSGRRRTSLYGGRRKTHRSEGYDLEAGLVGLQPLGANSNVAKSKPGATVQPTSVQSPVVEAACQACGGTMPCGSCPAATSGPSVIVRWPASLAISSVSGAPSMIVPDLDGIDAMPVRAFA